MCKKVNKPSKSPQFNEAERPASEPGPPWSSHESGSAAHERLMDALCDDGPPDTTSQNGKNSLFRTKGSEMAPSYILQTHPASHAFQN